MNIEREEYEKAARVPNVDKINARAKTLTAVRQASVHMDLLTGDPNWDVFLSYLQAMVKGAAESRDGLMNMLADPKLVDPNRVSQMRIDVMLHNERITNYQTVMEIPSRLRKSRESADIELKKLMEIAEPAKPEVVDEAV